MFTQNRKKIYAELANAVNTGKLSILYTLSIPSSRSTLLNFSLTEAFSPTGNKFDVAVHEPFVLRDQIA